MGYLARFICFLRNLFARSTSDNFPKRCHHTFGDDNNKTTAQAVSHGNHPRPQNGLSYVKIPGSEPLLDLTVGQLLKQAKDKYKDKECVFFARPENEDVSHSFEEIDRLTDAFAAGLFAIGLVKGDCVGVWGPNSLEWYLTHMAVMKAGMILVNINPAYQQQEVEFCINKVGVKCIVISDPFKSTDYYKILVNSIGHLGNWMPGKMESETLPSLTSVICMHTKSEGTFSFTEIMTLGHNDPYWSETLSSVTSTVNSLDVCNIQFTSGTTGRPKAVMLTHHGLVNNAYFIGKRGGFSSLDRICMTVPLFHCYGSVQGALLALHYGATCVFPGPGFNPQISIDTALERKCTVIYGTPTMHIDMLNLPIFSHDAEFEVSELCLRLACTGGAICPEPLIKDMKKKYRVQTVDCLYGMTETSPIVTQSLQSDSDALRSSTVGFPQEHVEVKLMSKAVDDKEASIIPLGDVGEVWVRGYMNMRGYWGDVAATALTITPDGWLRTGDLGAMLPSGHLQILSRLKDMINRGGENIYPKEVEDFLLSHPDIKESYVFGIPDYRLGEDVAVWVQLKPDRKPMTQKELVTFCKGKIAHFKIPKYVHFTSEFPKTVSGKVQKFVMREITLKNLSQSKTG